MKSVRQQRHLRRLCEEVIVSRTCEEHCHEENQKRAREEKPTRKKEEELLS
jgi:hypothetical protein